MAIFLGFWLTLVALPALIYGGWRVVKTSLSTFGKCVKTRVRRNPPLMGKDLEDFKARISPPYNLRRMNTDSEDFTERVSSPYDFCWIETHLNKLSEVLKSSEESTGSFTS